MFNINYGVFSFYKKMIVNLVIEINIFGRKGKLFIVKKPLVAYTNFNSFITETNKTVLMKYLLFHALVCVQIL